MTNSGIDTRKRWWALIVLCLGVLMIVLDTTIVNVALPSIRTDLGFTETSLVWVVNAYMLAFGGFLLLGGRLGDLFGHRRLFLLGITLFTLASLACGLANLQTLLIAARAVQGLGGAVVSAVALSLIMNLFTEPAERAKAMGVYGFVCAGRGSIGVLLGLAFLPANLIMAAFSLGLSARLVMRLGIRLPLATGLLLAAAGLALFARAPVDGNFALDVLPGMILLGLGAGVAFNPVLLAAISDVSPSESGLASGVVNTSFMMGGALGLAVLASLAAARTDNLLASGVSSPAALTGGYHIAFVVGAVFAAAAAFLSAVLLRAGHQAHAHASEDAIGAPGAGSGMQDTAGRAGRSAAARTG